ncbi:MAG: phytanoyl-CoA dioxygenase family protein [Thermoleophilia bacterium]|nr:phytanoyl-CoA dioxygenase family protein [Thermoleophilia bacterium]
MFFRSRKNEKDDGATAVADRSPAMVKADELEQAGDFMGAVEALAVENRAARDMELERRMVRLRHRAGVDLVKAADSPPMAEPDYDALKVEGDIPEINASEMSAPLARAAMLRHGCLIVRGVVPEEEAIQMRDDIERSFQARDDETVDGYFEEFVPDPPFTILERRWVSDGGGIWAADSPKFTFDMVEAFDRVGLQSLVEDYLGERPAFSVNKCTLRRVPPEAGTAWHQDGAFLGDVKALNVWMSLSRCGDIAPSLDIVPKRIEEILPTGTDDALFPWSISDKVAEEAAGDTPILRPIFNPGDVILFDDVNVHRTGVDSETMTENRYAIESWFFGPSTFPDEYVPLAF